jgi:hypothetical protein
MEKHRIQRRSVSEAISWWSNPDGDPFNDTPPTRVEDTILFGLGLGL